MGEPNHLQSLAKLARLCFFRVFYQQRCGLHVTEYSVNVIKLSVMVSQKNNVYWGSPDDESSGYKTAPDESGLVGSKPD